MDLKTVLRYDSETGDFTWIKTEPRLKRFLGKKAGGKAGTYIKITALGKEYLAHRLAWFFYYGTWPKMVDHINGNGMDNRISNLRESNHMLNARNLTIHRNGKIPYVHKHGSSWRGKIMLDKKNVVIGTFDSEKEAAAAVFGYLKGADLLQAFGLGD